MKPCVSQTGSSRLLPWFPQWKEQWGEGEGEGGERWEEKWTCHVMMTLRSRDFFGREVINPQEVMMALSPQERLIHTWINTQTDTKKKKRRRGEETGRVSSFVDFTKFLCFTEMHNLCNHKACLILTGAFLLPFSLWVPLVKVFRSSTLTYSLQLN